MKGYAAIALDRVKNEINLGQALRAAGAFGASLVVASGRRLAPGITDTENAYKSVPLIRVDHIMSAVPYGCIPVVIERCVKAQPLEEFRHPERAYYILGPEDGSVLDTIVQRCPLVVCIKARSLNLAATVNIVLYDRQLKQNYNLTNGNIRSKE